MILTIRLPFHRFKTFMNNVQVVIIYFFLKSVNLAIVFNRNELRITLCICIGVENCFIKSKTDETSSHPPLQQFGAILLIPLDAKNKTKKTLVLLENPKWNGLNIGMATLLERNKQTKETGKQQLLSAWAVVSDGMSIKSPGCEGSWETTQPKPCKCWSATILKIFQH